MSLRGAIATKQSPIEQIVLIDRQSLYNGKLLRGAVNAAHNDISARVIALKPLRHLTQLPFPRKIVPAIEHTFFKHQGHNTSIGAHLPQAQVPGSAGEDTKFKPL